MKYYKVIENDIEYDVKESENGDKYWHYKGYFYRENGPAIENKIGSFWYKNGGYHREDGPAVMYTNGTKQYWLDGIWYQDITSDDEWIVFNIIT